MKTGIHTLILWLFIFSTTTFAAGGGSDSDPDRTPFPRTLDSYNDAHITGILEKLAHRITEDPFNLIASIIFLCAIIHTFLASKFMDFSHHLEHKHRKVIEKEGRTAEAKDHPEAVDDVSFGAKAFHFLGEIEAVFGIWVIPLMIATFIYKEPGAFAHYLTYDVNFTEPLFVVIIMSIAATRPVLLFAESCLRFFARFGKETPAAWWLSILIIAPLLGSFITEPAAMTIGALLLSKKFYEFNPSARFRYATLGLLFVNISVGGTLTHFAAPPVLMVAGKWGWDTPYMMTNFGWKAAIGILIATSVYYLFFKKEFSTLKDAPLKAGEEPPTHSWQDRNDPVPAWVTICHLAALAWTVLFAHDPPMFMGGFLFFMAFTEATSHHQNPLSIRTSILVGFFLAGLVIHGGFQAWWIEPVLRSLGEWPLMVGSTVLTAFNDNAAITYLASLVPDFEPHLKYAVVAGAVTGGGLTVIANAPNPAGQSILSKFFDGSINALYLAASALIPTIILGLCFMLL